MSREIKFRAWNSIDKCMCDDSTTLTNLRGFIKSKHYHPMQFTGLEDKNGVEIYEGDIIDADFEGEHCPAKIVFENGGFRLAYPGWDVSLRKPHLTSIEIDFRGYYVIGNIHQNKELLK